MSCCEDFIVDFPRRCHDVLKTHWKEAKQKDREVTLLLMTAISGFVMPYERLGQGMRPEERWIRQPNLDPRDYTREQERLRRELDNKAGHSRFFHRPDEWQFGAVANPELALDDWPELRHAQPMSPDTPVSEVLRCLRNGLAHCNVMVRPEVGRDIGELIFVSGGTKKDGKLIPFHVIVVPPGELKNFVERWFQFLGELAMPISSVSQVLEEAA